MQETTTRPSTTATESGIPSSMPRIIQPPGGSPATTPENTVLVQVGFNYGLNYPFVAGTAQSANQIFQYLPQGVSAGLNLSPDKIQMRALEPYDTTADLGYITTLAQFYIPENLFSQLQLDIRTPISGLYTASEDVAVHTLMSLINPTIPLMVSDLNPSAASAALNPAAATSAAANDAAPLGGGAQTSSPVKASSVGIALAAIGGVSAYGAAMFFVARRYRRKHLRHSRASSVPSTGTMSHTGAGVFMSGARGGPRSLAGRSGGSRESGSSNGRSVRTQVISAPVAQENSLGWN
ncbi:hypothetical protein H2199_008233 [Coniosporium tulheliwenetii]|nr:hypothetical protein H2199_008233 [Cladosporium sp. JES 115]